MIVAAGRGERLGLDVPKAFAPLAGRPMVEWAIEALTAASSIEHVVIALPPGVNAPAGTIGVVGGAHRSLSVKAALRAVAGDPVVVHDAARPLLTPELVEAVLGGLIDADAAIAAAPVTDTIKEARDGEVVRTLDRSGLWAVQTPQAFHRVVLERALEQDEDVLAAATDDASLVEAMGGTVRIVEAPRENLKVTTPLDLRLAELLLGDR
ncbi:MAG: 2-C-methyl-D-erythritol 4-phosphate cytidylyltransferase [Solirubrobacteraceae bacterium]